MKQIKRPDMFAVAETLLSMTEKEGMTQEKLAKEFGVSQSYIANKLRLLRLDDEEREKVLSSGLSERHIRALLRFPDKESRMAAADVIISEYMNVEKTEAYIDSVIESKNALSSNFLC